MAAADELFSYQMDEDTGCLTGSPLMDLLRQRRPGVAGSELVFLRDDDPAKAEALNALFGDGQLTPLEDRCLGAMIGMAIGDALGAPLEFSPVRYGVRTVTDMGTPGRSAGAFHLMPGQWTDDASMGLCVADSLLYRGEFDPLDMMLRFQAWWELGYCNSFMYDAERQRGFGGGHSVGLGGNISSSFALFRRGGYPFTPAGDARTSGCGSVMRLAGVPVRFHDDVERGMAVARAHSLITHQGEEAAECCRLQTFVMHRGFHGDGTVATALADLSGFASSEFSVNCMAHSQAENPAAPDPNRNWNWRVPDYRFSPTRAKQQPGYIGSYAMDNLCMALHCVHSTPSFEEALLKCVNQCGDADSVGSTCGQLAGAIYGASAIPKEWVRAVFQWDRGGDIALRALKLARKEFVHAPQAGAPDRAAPVTVPIDVEAARVPRPPASEEEAEASEDAQAGAEAAAGLPAPPAVEGMTSHSDA